MGLPGYLKVLRFESHSTNLYLIEDGGEVLLVDAHYGPEAEKALEAVEKAVDVACLREVVLTHWHYDHVGACPLISNRFHVRFSAHPADAWMIEDPWSAVVSGYAFGAMTEEAHDEWLKGVGGRGVKVGRLLRDGDTVKVGGVELRAIHSPGHTQGGVSLYDPVEKALYSGDALTPTINFDTWLGMVVDAYSYKRTLDTFSGLPLDALLPAHESIKTGGEAEDEVRKHIERFNRVEEETLAALCGEDGGYLNDVADEVVGKVLIGRSDEASFTEVHTVHSILQKLIFDGKVRLVKGKYYTI